MLPGEIDWLTIVDVPAPLSSVGFDFLNLNSPGSDSERTKADAVDIDGLGVVFFTDEVDEVAFPPTTLQPSSAAEAGDSTRLIDLCFSESLRVGGRFLSALEVAGVEIGCAMNESASKTGRTGSIGMEDPTGATGPTGVLNRSATLSRWPTLSLISFRASEHDFPT